MGCNCKQRNAIIDTYGTPEDETILEKVSRNLLRVVLFIIAILVGVIVTPIIMLVAVYKIFFTKGEDRMIVLPKMLSKHLRNGE